MRPDAFPPPDPATLAPDSAGAPSWPAEPRPSVHAPYSSLLYLPDPRVRWGLPTAGMFDLAVDRERRRGGLATYLLSEAFERLRNRGIRLVEAQTMHNNTPALSLYEKLGFVQVDEGVIYRKE